MEIEVDNVDSITAALQAVQDGYRPLVLNMANEQQPGGGFLTGAQAQEEDLFRCTNLYRTLTEDLYPMHECEVIYTPKAHIFRDATYQTLESPVEVGFISVAATANPPVVFGRLSRHVEHVTEQKVRMTYHIGLIQRHDCLIMGALGCGVYNNPPRQIAKIFCKVTEEYAGRFKKIIFPIKSGPNNPNYDVFKAAFIEAFSGDGDRDDLTPIPN